jgi:hypothetical protein
MHLAMCFMQKTSKSFSNGIDENPDPKFSTPCIIVSIDASSPTSVRDQKKHIGKLVAMLTLLIIFLWDFVVTVDEEAMPPQHCGHRSS